MPQRVLLTGKEPVGEADRKFVAHVLWDNVPRVLIILDEEIEKEIFLNNIGKGWNANIISATRPLIFFKFSHSFFGFLTLNSFQPGSNNSMGLL
jgi:hypothetical protein